MRSCNLGSVGRERGRSPAPVEKTGVVSWLSTHVLETGLLIGVTRMRRPL